jgi:hypothetical protein
MVAHPMRRALVVVVGLAVLAGGCGGGARQDADEPSGTFKVEIVRASFPARQHIAEPVVLRLRVRNADSRSLPNVAVTVLTHARPGAAPAAFGQRQAPGSGLSDSLRPVWVLDRGPLGGETADQNVWDAGPLSAGQARTLTWRLVAAKAGSYTIAYRVFPGLTGRAKAARGHTSGTFRVRIIDRPVAAHVGPDGQVVRGPLPGSSGR